MLVNSFVLRIFSLVAMLIAIRLFFVDLPEQYSLLPALPFFCSFLYLLTDQFIGKKKIDVATLLILTLTFVRYCILSALMYYGNFYAETSWSHTQEYFNNAIVLMIYEAFFILLALVSANEICLDKPRDIFLIERDFVEKSLVASLLLFIVAVFAVYPDTSNLFNSILQLNQLEFTQGTRIDKADVGAIKRIVQTLFSVVFFVFRVVFPVYVLNVISRKFKSPSLFICFTLLFVALQFVFITATFAESIVCSLTILLCANKINPDVGRKLVRISPFFVASIVIVYFYVRYLVNLSSPYKSMYSGTNFGEYLCALFNAYFTGPFNVAGSFISIDENFWNVFYSTFVGTIPFNSTIFGTRGVSIQSVYNLFNHSYGQIPSSIGDGFYFFNTFFSPIFSFALTFFSVLLCRKAGFTKSYRMYLAYIFSSIVFALGIAMYNEHISLSWFNQGAVPMFLFAFLCEKRIYLKREYEIKG